MNLKIKQGTETKTKLIENAKKMFAKDGFNGTRFDEIAKSEGLTTGAMYHHFKNKNEIFDAVFEKCSKDIAGKVEKEASNSDDICESIVLGCIKYIKEVISIEYKKIVLEDAISVLGWKRWKEIDDITSENSLFKAISEAQFQKKISSNVSAKSLARFISGGTNELALWVAESGADKNKNLKECNNAISEILNSIKVEKTNDKKCVCRYKNL